MGTLNFSEIIRQALAAFRRAVSGPVLIVSLGTFAVRGLIVSRAGRGAWKVERYAEVELDTSLRRGRARFLRLLEKMRPSEARRVLIVSDEVRLIHLDLPRAAEDGRVFGRLFGRRRRVLLAQAGAQIAPFLEYPREEAMLAVRECPAGTFGPEDELGAEDEPGRPVLVCAMRRAEYESFENLCRSQKKQLIGVLPQECFAFAAHGGPHAEDSIMLDCGPHEIMGAYLYQGAPCVFEREAIAADEDAVVAARRLAQRLAAPGRTPGELITGGEAAGTKVLETRLGELGLPGARAWSLEEDLSDIGAPGPLPGSYVQAAGAAACLALHRRPPLLLTSRPGPAERILTSMRTIPLLILLLALCAMGGDYVFWKQRTLRVERAAAGYTDELRALQADIEGEKSMQRSYAQLRTQKDAHAERISLLELGIPERDARLVKLLNALIRVTPAKVQITGLHQFSDAVFFIEARSTDAPGITAFVMQLKALEGVRECSLESSQRQSARGGAGGEMNIFRIRLRLEDGHG